MVIGFITGGQLGRMMIESFLPLRTNEHIHVLDTSPHCPCSVFADKMEVGSSKDYEAVMEFGKQCDTIILEFEHVNIEALYDLEKMGKRIITQPKHLEIIQDKGRQKRFLQENGIPTAEFFCIENPLELEQKMTENNFSFPIIQKTCIDGYDGGGVKKVGNKADSATLFTAPSVIEKCIDIEKEFSLIIGRDDFGSVFSYPLIEQSFHQKTHIVDLVWFAQHVPSSVLGQVSSIGEKIMHAFGGTGMYAIELFLDKNGTVLVNEIAPRVHNSGHHTIECSATSQFEQYMRIALGYSAGSTKTVCSGVMCNVLGEEEKKGKTEYKGLDEILKREGVHVHLYGKKTCSPNRKMGHITVVGESEEAVLQNIPRDVLTVYGKTE